MPVEELDSLVQRMFDRGFDQEGTQRQLRALLATGDLRRFGKKVGTSTLVIHGDADRMIPIACGKAVARAIPDARFETIKDMAHDLPRALRPRVISLLTGHFNGNGRKQHLFN
jgi:pimeloyl-ACP methyl ester carboxylesterase